MDPTSDRVELQPGMEVVSRDGEKLGKVVTLTDAALTVEKGFFFPHDYFIPMSAVESADDETIYLNLSKDDALNQNWGAATSTTTSTSGAAYDELAAADLQTGAAASATGSTRATDDTLTIPVHEEELTATKRAADAGQVQINTKVISEDRTLEVPITEERVHVTRRVVNRDAAGDAAFREGTINVPVQTEQVDVQKRVRVAEEVEVAKDAVQKTQQVSGTVRREVVNVDDTTANDVTDGTSGTPRADDASTRR